MGRGNITRLESPSVAKGSSDSTKANAKNRDSMSATMEGHNLEPGTTAGCLQPQLSGSGLAHRPRSNAMLVHGFELPTLHFLPAPGSGHSVRLASSHI